MLLGSTGPLGREVLRNNKIKEVKLRAFARKPEALTDEKNCEYFEVVKGDVRDLNSLEKALDGIDVVISTLGSKPFQKGVKDFHEEAATNLLKAMNSTGAHRIIAITGIGAGDSLGHGPLWYDKIIRPTVLKKVYDDKERMEEILQTSDLEWEIVRPGVLKNKSTGKAVKAIVNLKTDEKIASISRADVADFLLKEAIHPEHTGEIVHLYT
ncbi:MAG: NAD(P)H-binding protein [Micrococcaceae bacterium]